MTDTDKILQKLDEQGRKIDEQGRNIAEQAKQLTQLQSDVSTIKADVAKNELNIEAFRAEQRQANEDLVQLVIKTYDDTAEQSQALEKRVARIEKHPNLPPTR